MCLSGCWLAPAAAQQKRRAHTSAHYMAKPLSSSWAAATSGHAVVKLLRTGTATQHTHLLVLYRMRGEPFQVPLNCACMQLIRQTAVLVS